MSWLIIAQIRIRIRILILILILIRITRAWTASIFHIVRAVIAERWTAVSALDAAEKKHL